MAEEPHRRRHIFVHDSVVPESFRRPGGGDSKGQLSPKRYRYEHGTTLKKQVEDVEREVERLNLTPPPEGLVKENGTYLKFESDAGFQLVLESLENRTVGIELVAVNKVVDITHAEPSDSIPQSLMATVYVPDGKLAHFTRILERYLTEETPAGNPKNQALVESISKIGLAKLRDLWTEFEEPFPDNDSFIWWEAWLRGGRDALERQKIVEVFRSQARNANLPVSQNQLNFPEATVLLIGGSPNQLSDSVFLLDSLAEVRKAREAATFYINLSPHEAQQWVKDALDRIEPPKQEAPAVCLLDTGVNQGHPLIALALDTSDMHAYNQSWGTASNPGDQGGHGTEMAGVSLYGDLRELLGSQLPVQLKHRLESVKILPPTGVNDPLLYGDLTRECIARAEVQAPDRQRVVCMPVTSDEDPKRLGRPSSWSSAIDQICAGSDNDGEHRRLVIVSAGNARPESIQTYPDGNMTDSVHDPGQAWNAVTVGGYTQKDFIDPDQYPGWKPLAMRGKLSPSSTTSNIWERKWPIKPDIVLEGGNYGIDPAFNYALAGPESLRVLTTNSKFVSHPLTITGDTSAATSFAARMAAMTMAEYPMLWPETIRALLIHSAFWTPAMLGGRDLKNLSGREKRELLQTYGYGVPRLDRALYSAFNSLTLIAEEYLHPFKREDRVPIANQMNLHRLPWPRDVLRGLGETRARMHITLSYFVEPNPGSSRNYTSKYRYASHGLRFDVKNPLETQDQFRKRVNMAARDEAEEGKSFSRAGKGWLLGANLRTLGSAHSDYWFGTAADLADMEQVIVFPVTGWWKTRYHLDRWGNSARYSIIVSIHTQSETADIYTPVQNRIVIST